MCEDGPPANVDSPPAASNSYFFKVCTSFTSIFRTLVLLNTHPPNSKICSPSYTPVPLRDVITHNSTNFLNEVDRDAKMKAKFLLAETDVKRKQASYWRFV